MSESTLSLVTETKKKKVDVFEGHPLEVKERTTQILSLPSSACFLRLYFVFPDPFTDPTSGLL